MEPPTNPPAESETRVGEPTAGTPTSAGGGGPTLVPVDNRPPAWRTFAILVAAVVLIVAAVWIVPNLVGGRSSEATSSAAPSTIAVASLAAPSAASLASPAASAASPGPAVPGPSVSLPPGRTLPPGSI